VSSSTLFTGSDTVRLLALPQSQNDHESKRFESIQDIEAATRAQLKTLTKEDFQNCFRKWQERWDTRVRSEGKYIEGD